MWSSLFQRTASRVTAVAGLCGLSYCSYSLAQPELKVLMNRSESGRGSKHYRKHYEYVIIGGGTAAYTALEAIRQMKPEGSVLLISDDQQIARLDVDVEPDHVSGLLQDVYNEWRRHIVCRLDIEDVTRNLPLDDAGSAGLPQVGAVRKWSTRREFTAAEEQPKHTVNHTEAVSLLIEDPAELCIDPEEKVVTLSDGSSVEYGKCLIATTGKPRDLYVLKSSLSYSFQEKMNSLRNIQDFQNLYHAAAEGGKRILVVGGGYLGTCLCAALMDINRTVLPEGKRNIIEQTFVEAGPLHKYFPPYLSEYLASTLRRLGLVVLPDRLVTSISRDINPSGENECSADGADVDIPIHSGERNEPVSITLMQGPHREYLDVDYVVLASTNVDPGVGIAKRSHLEIDRKNGGIVVNSSLEAYDSLFVAGSAASYFDPSLGRRRVDFYDNALNTGLLAGQNMASDDGRLRRYYHQPTLRCTLPGTGLVFEAVGDINSNLSTCGVWLCKRDPITGKPLPETAYERGVVYYLRDNIVVGVLCCNASECLEAAREVLREKTTVDEARKKIMLAPSQWIKVIRTK